MSNFVNGDKNEIGESLRTEPDTISGSISEIMAEIERFTIDNAVIQDEEVDNDDDEIISGVICDCGGLPGLTLAEAIAEIKLSSFDKSSDTVAEPEGLPAQRELVGIDQGEPADNID